MSENQYNDAGLEMGPNTHHSSHQQTTSTTREIQAADINKRLHPFRGVSKVAQVTSAKVKVRGMIEQIETDIINEDQLRLQKIFELRLVTSIRASSSSTLIREYELADLRNQHQNPQEVF